MENQNSSIETPITKIHWLIHDACFAIKEGKTEEAQKLLSQADAISHDLCNNNYNTIASFITGYIKENKNWSSQGIVDIIKDKLIDVAPTTLKVIEPTKSRIIDIHKIGNKYLKVCAIEQEIDEEEFKTLKNRGDMVNIASIFDEAYSPKQ